MDEQQLMEMKQLLREAGSTDPNVAIAKQMALAAQLTVPVRSGVLSGTTIDGIFTREVFDPNARIEYPIDFYRPDNAGEFVAYVVPNQGRIPQRQVEGDYTSVPTYDIASSIDFLIRYAREARWDILSRALEVLEAGMVMKINDDAWHTIQMAGYDRNIIVSDANASAGQFTKKLISLMKLVMRRNGGGNSGSMSRTKLTNLFVSPEAMEDMRDWGVDQLDDVTRREIFVAEDGSYNNIYSVKITDLDELGENQAYQDFYTNVVVPAGGGSGTGLTSGDVELVIGLDTSKQDSFVMPIRDEIETFADPALHRENRMGFYSRGSFGVGVLDNTRVLLGSL